MIYLDNAATSWPKPQIVYDNVFDTMVKYGANPGRGSHKLSIEAGKIVLNTREELSKLLNADNPLNIIFTCNCTASLNIAIKGVLHKNDHVIITSMEHNSVLRPLNALKSDLEITYDIVWCDKDGLIDVEDIRKTIKPNTKMIITTIASNVCGSIMPVEEISKIAKEYGIIYLIDGAQGVGYLDMDVKKLDVDLIALPGHKGLLGPQGTGVLYIKDGLELDTIIEGGTGSYSEMGVQPRVLPDMLESGTLNTPGIAGLGAGVRFIIKKGLRQIREHERYLTEYLIHGLSSIKGVRIYGSRDINARVPVVCINIKDADSSYVSHILDQKYDIATRSGLHCAVLAHKTLGTIGQGTVRFCPGIFNTISDIKQTIKAVYEIAKDIR